MDEAFAEVARQQIEDVDLPSTIYRTARRLLDRAERSGGNLSLGVTELLSICQTEAEATMRSHLVQLAGAGIIAYRRRGTTITIQFEAWANPELPWGDDAKVIAGRSNRALVDQSEGTGGEEVIAQRSDRALSDQIDGDADAKVIAERSNRALSDQNGGDSLTRAPARALVGWLVDPSLPNEGRDQKPTNQPKRARKAAQTPPVDAYQQMALDLLVDRDIGITYEVAEILARSAPALDIYRVVDNWLPDFRQGKVKTGALVSRIQRIRPSREPTVTLSKDFCRSDLYHRHKLPEGVALTPDDLDRRNYFPPEYADIILGGRYNHPDDYTDLVEADVQDTGETL